jgi:serine kinase of HPr protein (carbohydrate metabolism regulator)
MIMLLHATCVAIGERAVLITGPSGAGKSDLALRLIDRGGMLVSDDQVSLSLVGGVVQAEAPATIAGKIEVRGLGVAAMAYRSPMPVALLIELAPLVERMPEDAWRAVCGVDLPLVGLSAFEISAPIKAELALRMRGLPL